MKGLNIGGCPITCPCNCDLYTNDYFKGSDFHDCPRYLERMAISNPIQEKITTELIVEKPMPCINVNPIVENVTPTCNIPDDDGTPVFCNGDPEMPCHEVEKPKYTKNEILGGPHVTCEYYDEEQGQWCLLYDGECIEMDDVCDFRQEARSLDDTIVAPIASITNDVVDVGIYKEYIIGLETLLESTNGDTIENILNDELKEKREKCNLEKV
jgi:hypothetical protein